jgi:glycosyltransferase involved in cell wall biosynthesis
MRLCFIGDASGYHVGRWIRYFGKVGHETHCISTASASLPGVVVHPLENKHAAFGFRHLFYPRYYLEAKRLITELQPDVIHGLQINHYTYLAMRSGRRPFVITPFGGDVLVNPKKSRLAKHMAEYCLRNCDLITTDALHIQETLIDLGAEQAKINLVYFATDVEQYRPMPKDDGLMDKLGIRGCLCVISLRHLMPIYNIETLIRSIPIVRARIPEIKYLILSRGPEENMLKALADSLGVSGSIRWIGFLPGEELPRYVNLGDIYVSTSLSDAGLAASTGEAMACGLPAIITDFGDNRQWVQDDINGYLFPVRDAEALAGRILALAGNPDQRTRMGKQNRKTIEDRYNWAKEMAKMEQIYRCLAERTKTYSHGR